MIAGRLFPCRLVELRGAFDPEGEGEAGIIGRRLVGVLSSMFV